jgi:hypothetical protein
VPGAGRPSGRTGSEGPHAGPALGLGGARRCAVGRQIGTTFPRHAAPGRTPQVQARPEDSRDHSAGGHCGRDHDSGDADEHQSPPEQPPGRKGADGVIVALATRSGKPMGAPPGPMASHLNRRGPTGEVLPHRRMGPNATRVRHHRSRSADRVGDLTLMQQRLRARCSGESDLPYDVPNCSADARRTGDHGPQGRQGSVVLVPSCSSCCR